MGRLMAAAATAAAAVLVAASPASATIEVRDHWTDTWSADFSDCGIDEIHLDHDSHGLFTARLLKDSDGTAWLGHDNYWADDVFTNTANGRSVSVSYNGNFREVRGTRVEGNVWRFDWKDSGATWVLRDGAGNVVWRDRGTISGSAVYDTGGDHVVGGTEISNDVTSLKGQYKQFYWCADILQPYIG